jgi:thiazole synthase
MGADAVLVNSAIAKASDPTLMARGFQRATLAGRDAFLARPMPMSHAAVASSPLEGLPRRN